MQKLAGIITIFKAKIYTLTFGGQYENFVHLFLPFISFFFSFFFFCFFSKWKFPVMKNWCIFLYTCIDLPIDNYLLLCSGFWFENNPVVTNRNDKTSVMGYCWWDFFFFLVVGNCFVFLFWGLHAPRSSFKIFNLTSLNFSLILP